METCAVAGCGRGSYVRGWCTMHYARWRKTGDPLLGGRPSPRERFFSFVDMSAPSECWLWRGPLDGDGYGALGLGRRAKRAKAHRYAYELLVGPIPSGLVSHHLCRNKSCVNPSHIALVDRAEHPLLDETNSARHAAKTHCLRGHEFSEGNTYVDPRGRRNCRECSRIRWRRQAADARAKAAARWAHDS